MSKISVIIPVYNAKLYIAECLNSVINQSLKELEIICVDDGSTDNSLEILKEFASKDSRISVLKQKNSGAAVARNKGLEIAKGDFVAFLDSDDFYFNLDILKLLHETAVTNNVEICGASLAFFKNKKISRNKISEFSKKQLVKYIDVQFDYYFTRYIYSLDLLNKNNIRFPSLLAYEDPPFLVHAMLAAKVFYTIPDIFYCYRVEYKARNHNAVVTNDVLRGIIENLSLAEKNNLNILFVKTYERLIIELKNPIFDALKSREPEIIDNLIKIATMVKENFHLFKSYSKISHCIDRDIPIEVLFLYYFYDSIELQTIKKSISYKIGRAVTKIPRSINKKIKKIGYNLS